MSVREDWVKERWQVYIANPSSFWRLGLRCRTSIWQYQILPFGLITEHGSGEHGASPCSGELLLFLLWSSFPKSEIWNLPGVLWDFVVAAAAVTCLLGPRCFSSLYLRSPSSSTYQIARLELGLTLWPFLVAWWVIFRAIEVNSLPSTSSTISSNFGGLSLEDHFTFLNHCKSSSAAACSSKDFGLFFELREQLLRLTPESHFNHPALTELKCACAPLSSVRVRCRHQNGTSSFRRNLVFLPPLCSDFLLSEIHACHARNGKGAPY